MRALTVIPGQPGSAQLEDMPQPTSRPDDVLVQTLAVGICGTDQEILSGGYGFAPPGRQRLVLGHESLGRVVNAPSGAGLNQGDLVVGIVRRPDPEPCTSCAVGEWDMCRNGRYIEHGIKELDGFSRDRYTASPDALVRLDPSLAQTGVLLEPTSVVAKAWDHSARIGRRANWAPRRALITGAGPIGLLAALLARQLGLEADVLDRVTDGPKPQLVEDLGATYHANADVRELARTADVVIECTGVGQLVFDVLQSTPPGAIVCLTGISSGGRTLEVDFSSLNKTMVLENNVVFGSVNANRRHYETAADALAKADPAWLARLISRRVPPEHWQEAIERHPDDVKTVIDFSL